MLSELILTALAFIQFYSGISGFRMLFAFHYTKTDTVKIVSMWVVFTSPKFSYMIENQGRKVQVMFILKPL
jgi:hypothetical protein